MALAKAELGPIDLVVYSLASPVRTDPDSGEQFRSAIKPVGEVFHVKTLNVDKPEVHEVDLERTRRTKRPRRP